MLGYRKGDELYRRYCRDNRTEGVVGLGILSSELCDRSLAALTADTKLYDFTPGGGLSFLTADAAGPWLYTPTGFCTSGTSRGYTAGWSPRLLRNRSRYPLTLPPQLRIRHPSGRPSLTPYPKHTDCRRFASPGLNPGRSHLFLPPIDPLRPYNVSSGDIKS